MTNERIINNHTYFSYYAGVDVFVIDGRDYYSVQSAAEALGLTIEEFKEIW
jgi:hypothetical protein